MPSFDNNSQNKNGQETSSSLSRVTSRDLDVEDAAGQVLESVEQNHRQGSTASLLVGGATSYSSAGGAGGGAAGGDQESESRLFDVLSQHSSNSRRNSNNNNNNGEDHSMTSSIGSESVSNANANQATALKKTPSKPKFFEVAQQVRRMNMIKAALAKEKQQQSLLKHKHTSAAHSLLQDIQEEDETSAVLNNSSQHGGGGGGSVSVNTVTGASGRRRSLLGGGEKDGLFKKTSEDNPYAASYDHHLLKADSSCSSDSEDDEPPRGVEIPGPPQGHHRSQSTPFNFTPNSVSGGQQQPVLPLHGHMRKNSTTFEPRSASDYIATAQDGYIDVAGLGNTTSQSFATQHTIAHNTPTTIKTPKHKHFFPRWVREVCAMMHPFRVARNCLDIVVESYFLWVGVPCLLASACLFYLLDNPELDFLPGEATLAWWLLFATRQTVTLGLARMTVHVVVDGFMLGTRLAVQTLGPLLTLTAATGKGWPLITACWGLWNLILLHGDNNFQRNWLYFTHMDLFSTKYDSGGYILSSSLYTRILVSAILGGCAVSAKRTVLALRFGRKQFVEFKPRLERILADVVLISEIATLAEQADKVEEAEAEEETGSWDLMATVKGSQNLKDFLWAPEPEVAGAASEDNEEGDEGNYNSISELPRKNMPSNDDVNKDNNNNNTSGVDRRAAFANSVMGHHADAFTSAADAANLATGDKPRMGRAFKRTSSGRFKIKDMLDAWEEPESKTDKGSDISIYDILKFRRALSHLDEDHPFGEAFGPAMNRDQCIASSHSVYHRLLKLAPATESGDSNAKVLTFDILSLLALNEDGATENLAKKRMLKKVFTPDPSGRLPLLAFIQACDQIYKRLRYFRASIRNSSVIDQVLERIANALFYFILAMSLSSLMELNPWAFMVSITSLLVSFSFALGSSISKYVEGVLLIAIRRPFDLGDRIFMSSADSINPLPDVSSNSWFVEDITLTTTTLRYSKTNEVSTVNNWSIAGSRIVNCARSLNAVVHFEFKTHVCILENQTLEKFQTAVQKYVDEHPRVWDSIAHIRHDEFDADDERISFALAIRHRSSWQEAGRIKLDRSEVFRFLYELGKKLDIHYEQPVDQRIIYQGGTLKRGDTDDFSRRELMRGPNFQ